MAAHPTTLATPDSPERHALYERHTCHVCHGTGERRDTTGRRAYRATCARCDAHWPAPVLAAHLDGAYGGWWGYRVPLLGDALWQLRARLPCGCAVWHARWQPEPCRACEGRGVRFLPARSRTIFAAVGASALLPQPTRSGRRAAHRIPGVPTTPPITSF